MYKHKLLSYIMLFLITFSIIIPVSTTQAAPLDNVLTTLGASTLSDQSTAAKSSGPLEKLFSFVFDKLLGPILNVFNGKSTTNPTTTQPVVTKPSPTPTAPSTTNGTLKGKVIVVDPGHGGSNPGAVANNTRESDNNLAVGLKLRDKLVQAGAKVIMTRETDRTVAAEGSSLGEELAARVNLAENNHADLFISVHTNENPDTSIIGGMTFYPSGKSSDLALAVQNQLINETGAVDKGTSAATFYVLRNAAMPSILVEMGFISNAAEAALLNQDSYRNKIAQGIMNGIVKYFN
ncbi:N-acetylmuramoyl-L-alanine amidase [Pelosinus sp. sgz500959]|uniref:N-acetylmuramoyl-L-alanine amidase family protein n=1 Tax=Pelosinus sp. sgz500959 TaxID=3242472 RepID=UPI00366CABA0